MAIIWMDGFDHYGNNAQIKSAGYTGGAFNDENPVTTSGRVFMDIGKSVQILMASNRFLKRDVGTNYTVIGTCAHLMLEQMTSNHTVFSFWDSANAIQLSINVNTTGRVEVRRGAGNGTLLATSASTIFSEDVYAHLEVKVTFDNSAGAVEVRANGNPNPIINITSVDTVNTANVNCRFVAISGGTAGSDDIWVDNWYIWDTTGGVNDDFLGQRRVETEVPDADTATEQWSLSTGSDSFALVDEIGPNSDTDYLFSNTNGNRTVLDTTDLLDTSGTCLAVAAFAFTRKTDVGDASYKLGIISNAVESQTADINPLTTYAYDYLLLNQNPDGPTGWTPTTAQAAQLSIENTTT